MPFNTQEMELLLSNNSVVKAVVQVAALLTCLSLFGCATNRSEIQLSSPAPAAVVAGGPEVVIRNVTDEREFFEKPRDPSMPSLGFGGAKKAADSVKAGAVGRKRNMWGKAFGDVVLEDGQTVTAVVRNSLALAFTDAGYRVVDAESAGADALVVDLRIVQLWAWIRPDPVSANLSARIAAELLVEKPAAVIPITVETADKSATASDAAWAGIVDQALAEFRREMSNAVVSMR